MGVVVSYERGTPVGARAHNLRTLQSPLATELPVFVRFTETDPLPLGSRSRLGVPSQLILSGCT